MYKSNVSYVWRNPQVIVWNDPGSNAAKTGMVGIGKAHICTK